MPVLLVADGDLQERPVSDKVKLHIPKVGQLAPPQGDVSAVAEAAKMLVAAENPVILADRTARTAAGMKLLVELAETLQAPVVNQAGRMNFPSRHPLNQTDGSRGLIANADVILGLEVWDFWGTVNNQRDQQEKSSRPITKSGVKLISVTASDVYKSNYQEFQRYQEVDLAIAGDSEATLPSLIEACKRLLTGDRKRAFEDRGKKLAAAYQGALERTRTEASYAWDASPISTARMAAELWAQVKDKDWSLVSGGGWSQRLWNFDKYYQFIGSSGGAGVGYGAPASVGAALANKKHGRFSVSIMGDGELMVGPGALWTAAKYKIPILTVMHNNRYYFQEVMHLQAMADRHMRDPTTAKIGTEIADPNIDFAKMAQSFGMQGFTVTDPTKLGAVLKQAAGIVKNGEPVLVDVVSQGR
jgi:thiamine pyrophosphate-dependent acetolactate synthase large subunit-like protein